MSEHTIEAPPADLAIFGDDRMVLPAAMKLIKRGREALREKREAEAEREATRRRVEEAEQAEELRKRAAALRPARIAVEVAVPEELRPFIIWPPDEAFAIGSATLEATLELWGCEPVTITARIEQAGVPGHRQWKAALFQVKGGGKSGRAENLPEVLALAREAFVKREAAAFSPPIPEAEPIEVLECVEQ